MGKVFDKHGRMKHDDLHLDPGSQMCGQCGRWVQNLTEHEALFHPKYRQDSLQKTEPTKLKPGKNQAGLDRYPDTAESAEAYDAERTE